VALKTVKRTYMWIVSLLGASEGALEKFAVEKKENIY
jgi:hypothetical protein